METPKTDEEDESLVGRLIVIINENTRKASKLEKDVGYKIHHSNRIKGITVYNPEGSGICHDGDGRYTNTSLVPFKYAEFSQE